MGGNVHAKGNVTPAAEFNFWVDPDAAKRVLGAFDVTLVDWGLCLRASVLGAEEFAAVAEMDTDLADFFEDLTEPVREFTSEEQGIDGVTQPDSLTAALLAYPELREETATYHV
ncbi:nucleoside hydrolase, partial [Halobacteriales archaeon SW_10_68_16]